MHEKTAYYIGLDIGGTKCAASLGAWDGKSLRILKRVEVKTEQDPKATLERLAVSAEAWLATYPVRRAGISCGGPLDPVGGVLGAVPNLPRSWHGFSIVAYVASRFGLAARLENDANASAVAEWKFGAGRGTKNMIFLTFGTGLGAGLILDGRLYSGTNGNAGEIGHVRLEQEGPEGYGKAGSAEGFCSGGGIRKLALLRAKEQGVAIEEDVSAKDIFFRAEQGDAFCRRVVVESAEKYGRVVSLLIDLFNPQVIVTGGVFMRNAEFFRQVMDPVLEKEALPLSREVCRILPAELRENIGDHAALAIAAAWEEEA